MFEEFLKFKDEIFVGYCTKPEIKYTEKGLAVCKFAIPLSEKKEEKPLWLNCKLYRELAEAFAERCIKGCKVMVTGKLYQYEYNGNVYTEFAVHDFRVLAEAKEKEVE